VNNQMRTTTVFNSHVPDSFEQRKPIKGGTQ
jgi:hypothetical protein